MKLDFIQPWDILLEVEPAKLQRKGSRHWDSCPNKTGGAKITQHLLYVTMPALQRNPK